MSMCVCVCGGCVWCVCGGVCVSMCVCVCVCDVCGVCVCVCAQNFKNLHTVKGECIHVYNAPATTCTCTTVFIQCLHRKQ